MTSNHFDPSELVTPIFAVSWSFTSFYPLLFSNQHESRHVLVSKPQIASQDSKKRYRLNLPPGRPYLLQRHASKAPTLSLQKIAQLPPPRLSSPSPCFLCNHIKSQLLHTPPPSSLPPSLPYTLSLILSPILYLILSAILYPTLTPIPYPNPTLRYLPTYLPNLHYACHFCEYWTERDEIGLDWDRDWIGFMGVGWVAFFLSLREMVSGVREQERVLLWKSVSDKE